MLSSVKRCSSQRRFIIDGGPFAMATFETKFLINIWQLSPFTSRREELSSFQIFSSSVVMPFSHQQFSIWWRPRRSSCVTKIECVQQKSSSLSLGREFGVKSQQFRFRIQFDVNSHTQTHTQYKEQHWRGRNGSVGGRGMKSGAQQRKLKTQITSKAFNRMRKTLFIM